MQLRDYYALGAVDDERAVISHQRNLTEEHFFFLDVTNRERFGFGILVVDGQADFHLQGYAVTHPAFLTLLLIVLMLQPDRLTAVFTKLGAH
jgi:hypothetical protein